MPLLVGDVRWLGIVSGNPMVEKKDAHSIEFRREPCLILRPSRHRKKVMFPRVYRTEYYYLMIKKMRMSLSSIHRIRLNEVHY